MATRSRWSLAALVLLTALGPRREITPFDAGADVSAEKAFLARRGSSPPNARRDAVEAMRAWHRANDSGVAPSYRWQSIGPSATGSSPFFDNGRVNGILMSPVDRNVIVVGTSGGGIWRSTDGGERFSPVTDDQIDLSVGAMAIAPSNPSAMYAAMGDDYLGTGVLKSADSGATWKRVTDAQFPARATSRRLRVDPSNENIVWLVQDHALDASSTKIATLALLKSVDSGATWSKAFGGTVSDVFVASADGKTVLAGVMGYEHPGAAGIYRSSDGGATWTLVYAGGDPDVPPEYYFAAMGSSIYAVALDSLNGSDRRQLVVSTDGGQRWTMRSDLPPDGRLLDIAVNPHTETIIVGGIGTYRSGDAGLTWRQIGTHPDHHAIAFDPFNASRVWIGNDGGLKRSDDDCVTVVSVSHRIPAMQLYAIAAHPTDPDVVVAGSQDNGLQLLSGSGPSTELIPGDYGNAVFDPGTSRILVASVHGVVYRASIDGSMHDLVTNSATFGDWQRMEFIPPLVRGRDGTVWLGTYRLFASRDFGTTWVAPAGDLDLTTGKKQPNLHVDDLTAIAVSDSDPRTLYTGSALGRIMITHDAAVTWTDITPAATGVTGGIAISRSNPAIAFVGFAGYGPTHVVKTTDAGATWIDLSAGLPNIPVNALYLDPRRADTLYAGTDAGVFRFNELAGTWEPFDEGMPPVMITSFTTTADGRLLAATYGRGVYQLVESGERRRSVRH